MKHSIQPVDPKNVKKIVSANEVKMFENVD